MTKLVRLGVPDLEEGELRGYEPDGGRLVCLAKVDGTYRAVDDWCNHAGCQLSAGWISHKDGRAMVVCPCHEIGFDLETGKNLVAPSMCGDQQAFRVVEADGILYAEIDEPESP